jgi:hypothetical protein
MPVRNTVYQGGRLGLVKDALAVGARA